MKQNSIKSQFTRELPFFMMVPALVWQVLFCYGPLALIVALSFSRSDIFADGFTLAHYAELFDLNHGTVIARSLIFATLNAFFCLGCAYPLAYFIARKVKRWKNVLLFMLMVPFWTNILVQIYAWFFVLERNGIVNTILTKIGIISQPLHLVNTPASIFIVTAYCYLPFMIMPLYSILEKLDERLIESSYDLGANSWQTFYKVTLPLSWPGVKTGFFLVLVPSFGEFVIPALMGGSKSMFVGSLISHYFLSADNIHAGSAFTIVSGIVLLCVCVIINQYFKKRIGVRGE